MENEFYRNCLAHLESHFEGKMVLTQREVADYLKIDPRTAKTRYGVTKDGIYITKLAQKLSKM